MEYSRINERTKVESSELWKYSTYLDLSSFRSRDPRCRPSRSSCRDRGVEGGQTGVVGDRVFVNLLPVMVYHS